MADPQREDTYAAVYHLSQKNRQDSRSSSSFRGTQRPQVMNCGRSRRSRADWSRCAFTSAVQRYRHRVVAMV
jgi:hypothetical protein